MADPLETLDVACIRAHNAGPLTLSGTNSWIVGRDPAWIVDPGPALDEHLERLSREVLARGGAGGIALTHEHGDHSAGVPALLQLLGAAVPVGSGLPLSGRLVLKDGAAFGPFVALALPGHAPGHFGFLLSRQETSACFTGDAVLGKGSVFVAEDMAGYLNALRNLKARDLDLLCPGHGPLVRDAAAHLDRYVAHRVARENRVLAAWQQGLRSEGDLLDAVWEPLPDELRTAAARTLSAHLLKLRSEGRLPA